MNSTFANGGHCREGDIVLSLAHCSWAFMQGGGKRAAYVQLYTGCLGWADTNFPLYFLGFFINLSQPFSADSLGKWFKFLPVSIFSPMWIKEKWKGKTSPWNKKLPHCWGHQVFWSRETPQHMGAHISTASGSTPAAAAAVHAKPSTGGRDTCTASCSLDPDCKCRLPLGLSCAFSCTELHISIAKPQ